MHGLRTAVPRARLAIRSDNGVPFASPNALFNLSKLSVWWLRLGIAIERIKPGHPQKHPWVMRLLAKKPAKLVAVAVANKMARIAWAIMAKGGYYRAPEFAAAA